jgi:hypothetical protein
MAVKTPVLYSCHFLFLPTARSQTVKECYGDYAYVYLSDTSVYNVTLGNVSSTYSTPNLQRYVFALPDGK